MVSNIRVNRHPERASYDREALDAILDEAYVAHVGVVIDGVPIVIPYACARVGDELVIHGSRLAGALSQIASGAPVCATVTHLDGLVLARSAFHTSMNYRSAVVHGAARVIDDPLEKRRYLDEFFDRVIPGRRPQLRAMNDREVDASQVVALSLDSASAKVRTGGPIEPLDDQCPNVWAGVVPLALAAGVPEPDTTTAAGVPAPALSRANSITSL